MSEIDFGQNRYWSCIAYNVPLFSAETTSKLIYKFAQLPELTAEAIEETEDGLRISSRRAKGENPTHLVQVESNTVVFRVGRGVSFANWQKFRSTCYKRYVELTDGAHLEAIHFFDSVYLLDIPVAHVDRQALQRVVFREHDLTNFIPPDRRDIIAHEILVADKGRSERVYLGVGEPAEKADQRLVTFKLGSASYSLKPGRKQSLVAVIHSVMRQKDGLFLEFCDLLSKSILKKKPKRT